MPPPVRLNHVFVDFENVPSVDLALVGDEPVSVTLLIGEKQKRLDLALVRQIHAHAAKVTLIEVGASGRNALDLVLAWHLGKIAERHPGDRFFVVSKDKDFDPLIAHLRLLGLEVGRVESFSVLPFLASAASKPKSPAPQRKPTVSKSERPAPPAGAAKTPPDERLAKLTERLKNHPKARPVRRKTLLSFINGFYGKTLIEPELEAIASSLQQQGIIAIDSGGRVSYL